MKLIDILIILLIIGGIVLAYAWRNRRRKQGKGDCCSCSGNCSTCGKTKRT